MALQCGPGVTRMPPIDNEPRNPYQPPSAELDVAPDATALPANIQGAIAGHYDFTIGEVLDESWKLIKGIKASFWGAAIVVGLIFMAVEVVCGMLLVAVMGDQPSQIVSAVVNGLVGALLAPFTMGIYMMFVRRALGQPVSFATAFSYFSKYGTAVVAGLLVALFTYLGLALLIIPGIYLAVGYQLTFQLVADQNLSPSEAMKTSRKAIGHRWWRVFGLGLAVGLLTGLSAFMLFIPLIWTVPWMMMTTGVLYRRIFYAPVREVATTAAPSPAAGPPPVGVSG